MAFLYCRVCFFHETVSTCLLQANIIVYVVYDIVIPRNVQSAVKQNDIFTYRITVEKTHDLFSRQILLHSVFLDTMDQKRQFFTHNNPSSGNTTFPVSFSSFQILKIVNGLKCHIFVSSSERNRYVSEL